MSAPPDLRAALDGMADEAVPMDRSIAAQLITRGQARRRRQLAGGLAVAAALVVGIPVAVTALRSTPSQGADPAGAPTGAFRFDPTVEVPWPWLHDLPMRLNEPLALTYNLNEESTGYHFRAVSASGRQWEVPGSGGDAPSLSPDGWKIAWIDHTADDLVLRDLRAGVEHRVDVAPGSDGSALWAPFNQTPMPWSPDGTMLAVNVSSAAIPDGGADPEQAMLLVHVSTGEVEELRWPGFVVGWENAGAVLALQISPGGRATRVIRMDTTDGTTFPVSSADLPDPPGLNGYVVTPDGTQVVTVDEWSGALDLVVFDVNPSAAGVAVGGAAIDCPDCTWFHPGVSISDTEVALAFRPTEGGVQQVVAVDIEEAGGARIAAQSLGTLVSFSPRFPELSSVSLATSVVSAGPIGTPHAATWWPGWYVDLIIYTTLGLLVLILLVRRVRRWDRAGRESADDRLEPERLA